MKRTVATTCILLMVLTVAAPWAEAAYKLRQHTIDGWNTYIHLTENRIDAELNTPAAFLISDISYLKKEKSPGAGNIQIQPRTTKNKGKEIEVKDGTIHHWMGWIFIPDTTVDKLLPWVQNYNQHSKFFKEVEQSKLLANPNPETFDIFLRLSRTKMGITATFNTNHTVVYRRHGAGRASSRSVATRIAQLKNAGKASEMEYPIGEDDGYLWRLNSYWRFAERDGGVVVQCETVGVSRPLGTGLSILNLFTLGKFKEIADSVARESLEDTLAAMRAGIRGVEKSERSRT